MKSVGASVRYKLTVTKTANILTDSLLSPNSVPYLVSLHPARKPMLPLSKIDAYICPSQLIHPAPSISHLLLWQLSTGMKDSQYPSTLQDFYQVEPDCSDFYPMVEEPKLQIVVPKEARHIQKIRRKKMKRHLLKKFRKRMYFTLKKQRVARKKKKMAVFQARLDQIRNWGESFSAEAFVQEELEKARRGGFYISIMNKK